METLTVIAPDKIGLLLEVTTVLGKEKINIESISLEVVGNKAIIRLILEKGAVKKAKSLLEKAGFQVVASDTLVIKLNDKPGELAKVAKILAESKVSIESVHVIDKQNGKTLDAIKVDDAKKAEKLLREYL